MAKFRLRGLTKNQLFLLVVAAVLAVVIPTAWRRLTETSDAVLELADSTARELPYRTTFDFKIRNIGPQTGYITSVEFEVAKIWEFTPLWRQTAAILPSGRYTTELPVIGAPYSARVELSQAVKSNDVDRFEIVAAHRLAQLPDRDYVMDVTAILSYNQRRSKLSQRLLLVVSRGLFSPEFDYYEGWQIDSRMAKNEAERESLRQLVDECKRMAHEIGAVPAVRSPHVTELLSAVAKIQSEPAK